MIDLLYIFLSKIGLVQQSIMTPDPALTHRTHGRFDVYLDNDVAASLSINIDNERVDVQKWKDDYLI